MSKIQRVRGTRDLMPEEKRRFRFAERCGLDIAARYGFGEMETPMFEFSEVFHRGLGETSDVISKETYSFEDRGGDRLTLRPEGTAGVARAFVSEGLAQNLPLKLAYCGPMFRYERPQKGRYRQFYQIGVESLGFESPLADVEVLALAHDYLGALGLGAAVELEINTLGDSDSRRVYRETLVTYLQGHREALSADSKIRLEKNPMRILDSKDEGDRAIIANAPALSASLNDSSRVFFDRVLKGLDALGMKYRVNERLVRGLDYYCHSVFEFTTTQLGAQGTVLAGGRYDGLIELMGGPRTPGVGWAAGIDRLAELMSAELLPTESDLIALIPADDAGELACLSIAHELRIAGRRVELILAGNVGKKMKKANGMNAAWALIIGESEVASGQITCKNLRSGEQKQVARTDLRSVAF